ncbi:MAG TPA: tryptophan synthase subunit alpha [Cyclobacteriaceae bacterium]|nr:tryptophan synthase subunit alpha [Cyclobacteriaceae bacterium]
MESRISDLFNRKNDHILSVFFTAGYPKFDDTIAIAASLEAAGVDLIEIGIPFSDPIADGPVIQESNKAALDNGMTVKKLIEQLKDIRKTVKMPILLMGYINPVLQYGFDAFCKDVSEAGADGLILPDLPLDEYQSEYKKSVEGHGLHMVFLVSPTTSEERIRKIDATTGGFIYAVSSSSTTGAKSDFSEEQTMYFKNLKSLQLKNPFLIGFGISNHNSFEKACQHGAGAIIGSAFISMLKASENLKSDIERFVGKIRHPG